jgi:hypothetical protein
MAVLMAGATVETLAAVLADQLELQKDSTSAETTGMRMDTKKAARTV